MSCCVFRNITEDLADDMDCLSIEGNRTELPYRSPKPGFKLYCAVCKIHLNTQDQYDRHIQGAKHLINESKMPAPDRKLEPVRKSGFTEVEIDTGSQKTTTIPRSYQQELMDKALVSDCLVYLPTGTYIQND